MKPATAIIEATRIGPAHNATALVTEARNMLVAERALIGPAHIDSPRHAWNARWGVWDGRRCRGRAPLEVVALLAIGSTHGSGGSRATIMGTELRCFVSRKRMRKALFFLPFPQGRNCVRLWRGKGQDATALSPCHQLIIGCRGYKAKMTESMALLLPLKWHNQWDKGGSLFIMLLKLRHPLGGYLLHLSIKNSYCNLTNYSTLIKSWKPLQIIYPHVGYLTPFIDFHTMWLIVSLYWWPTAAYLWAQDLGHWMSQVPIFKDSESCNPCKSRITHPTNKILGSILGTSVPQGPEGLMPPTPTTSPTLAKEVYNDHIFQVIFKELACQIYYQSCQHHLWNMLHAHYTIDQCIHLLLFMCVGSILQRDAIF